MAQQIIRIGATANDGTGDSLRVAFSKINQNFDEIYGNGFGGNCECDPSSLVDGMPDGALLFREGTPTGPIATNGTVQVMVTPDGVMTSPDGVTWTPAPNTGLPTMSKVITVDVGTAPNVVKTFVAVGDAGTIATSTNGLIWDIKTVPSAERLRDIYYGDDCQCGPGLHVAVVVCGDNGTILTSSDLEAWTLRESNTDLDLYSIAYDPNTGTWVVVGDSGAVVTSDNGVFWTFRTNTVTTITEHLRGAVFNQYTANKLFVTVGLGGVVYTSPNGVTWTERVSGTENDLFAVAVGSVIAVGDKGTIIGSNNGGVTWTIRDSGVTTTLRTITNTDDGWIATGDNSTILRSDDGVVWTIQRLPGKLSGSPSLIYDKPTNTFDLGNLGNLKLPPVGNIHIPGGNPGEVLSTDGDGNLTWIPMSGGGFDGDCVEFDPDTCTYTFENITTGNITVTGNTNLSHIGNVHIGGGYTGQILATDGCGNLYWTDNNGADGAMAAGNHTEVQYNRLGVTTGSANFTFNGSDLTVSGTVDARRFSGSGSLLTHIRGEEVVGAVDLATTAVEVGNAHQPNITSLGTLSELVVSGKSSLGHASDVMIAGGWTGYVMTTDGAGNLTWTNPSTIAQADQSYVTLRDGTVVPLG